MKRLALLAAGSVLAAIPAVIGLTGNPALSHRVPVRVPGGAQPVQVSDTQPEVQRQGRGSDDVTASPSARPSEHAEPGDDHGGNTGGSTGTSGTSGSSGGSGSGGSGKSGSGKSGGDDALGHG